MHFLAGLSSVASVTLTLYFLSNDIKQVQIGELFGIFMICLAIFDIPTGGLADMFGHKASVVTGLFFQAFSFLLFFLYPSYFGFLFGMIASAIGLAFQSGAISSLMYDLLHKEGLHEDFQKVSGRAGGYFLIASIIASPLGSLIYSHNHSMPQFLAFLFFLLAAIVTLFIKWEFKKKPATLRSYFSIIGTGTKLTFKNRILMAMVIIGIGLTVNRLVFNQNVSQPYIVDVGVNVAYLGLVAAAFSAVLALVSIHTHKITKRLGENFSLIIMIAIPSLTVIALSFINTLLALPVILILLMGHTFRDPVMAHIGQKVVDPDKRSTMASTVSFLVSISAGILLPYWGRGIDMFGMHQTLFFLGIFTLCMGSAGFLLFRTKKQNSA